MSDSSRESTPAPPRPEKRPRSDSRSPTPDDEEPAKFRKISRTELKAVGRVVTRTLNPFVDIDAVLIAGVSHDPDVPFEHLNSDEQDNLCYFRAITDAIPHLYDQLLKVKGFVATAGEATLAGRRDAAATDVKVVRAAIPHWCRGLPALDPDDKSDRGFNHPETAALLCPIDVSWEDESVQTRIRSGELAVTQDRWPSFMFEGYACPDLSELGTKAFRSEIMLKAYASVFLGADPSRKNGALPKSFRMSPTCVAKTCGVKTCGVKTCGVKTCGVKKMRPAILAYIAVLLRSALSADRTFSTIQTDTSVFNYDDFHNGIISWFAEEDRNVTEAIMVWWDSRLFPAAAARKDAELTGTSTRALFARHREARANDAT